jgi:hypothetical protein
MPNRSSSVHSDFKKILRKRKKTGESCFNRGMLSFYQRKWLEATRGLSIASDHGFEKMDADFMLGVCYFHLSKYEAAESILLGVLQQAKDPSRFNPDMIVKVDFALGLLPDDEPEGNIDSQIAPVLALGITWGRRPSVIFPMR